MEETAPLNGTTIKDQAWKEKKGFGPMVLLSLLLFVSVATAAVLYSNESSSDFVVGGDDRGGLNGAILRGSNVQDVVEIVASASSSNVEAHVGCRKSGSPTVFTKDMAVGVPGPGIYSQLDFTASSYAHFVFDRDDFPATSCPLSDLDNCFWRKCAEKCNNDPLCRTFSQHTRNGRCYLHRNWLCYDIVPHGPKYHTGDHTIVSGVCRPEADAVCTACGNNRDGRPCCSGGPCWDDRHRFDFSCPGCNNECRNCDDGQPCCRDGGVFDLNCPGCNNVCRNCDNGQPCCDGGGGFDFSCPGCRNGVCAKCGANFNSQPCCRTGGNIGQFDYSCPGCSKGVCVKCANGKTCCRRGGVFDISCPGCNNECKNCDNGQPCCRGGGRHGGFDFSCPGCNNGRI